MTPPKTNSSDGGASTSQASASDGNLVNLPELTGSATDPAEQQFAQVLKTAGQLFRELPVFGEHEDALREDPAMLLRNLEAWATKAAPEQSAATTNQPSSDTRGASQAGATTTSSKTTTDVRANDLTQSIMDAARGGPPKHAFGAASSAEAFAKTPTATAGATPSGHSSPLARTKRQAQMSPFAPCKECHVRLSYKTYYKEGHLPIAIIHHQTERYSWKEYYPHQPKAEEFFYRMLAGPLKKTPEHFHHMELLGCNTGTAQLEAEHFANCAGFLDTYFQKQEIQGVIMLGEAAVALYGREKAASLAGQFHSELIARKSGLPLGGVVVRSPRALAAAAAGGKRELVKSIGEEMNESLLAFKAALPTYFS